MDIHHIQCIAKQPIDNKKILDYLVEFVYQEHSAGGHFHIVLDDDNISDEDIVFCLNYVKEDAELSPTMKSVYYRLGGILLSMTMRERVEWKGFDWELWKQEEGIE